MVEKGDLGARKQYEEETQSTISFPSQGPNPFRMRLEEKDLSVVVSTAAFFLTLGIAQIWVSLPGSFIRQICQGKSPESLGLLPASFP